MRWGGDEYSFLQGGERTEGRLEVYHCFLNFIPEKTTHAVCSGFQCRYIEITTSVHNPKATAPD